MSQQPFLRISSALQRLRTSFAGLPRWSVVLPAALAVGSQFFLDWAISRLSGEAESNGGGKGFISKLYHPVLGAGSGSQSVERVFVVRIQPAAKNEREASECALRQQIAHVLTVVSAAHPDAILLNYAFPQRENCSDETAAIEASIRNSCEGDGVPVIGGFDLHRMKQTDLMVQNANPKCRSGAGNAATDLRMIPVFFRRDDQKYYTVSWLAAAAADQHVATLDSSDRFQPDLRLYTTLFREEQLEPSIMDDKDLPQSPGAIDLRRRVVIIASADTRTHSTYAGQLPTYVLQASYVENLLRGRYWRRMPMPFEIAVVLLFWLWLELAQSVREKVCHMLAGIAVLILLSWLTARLSLYSDYALISVGGLISWAYHAAEARIRSKWSSSPSLERLPAAGKT